MANISPRDLRLQKIQLEARIRRLQQREAARERGRDTRRKVLVGVLILGWMARDSAFAARVYRELNALLVRPVDRAVFGAKLSGAVGRAEGLPRV